jgi:peptidoglycan/xylan/chitin deacetylase (PgdA/CDA1 family)
MDRLVLLESALTTGPRRHVFISFVFATHLNCGQGTADLLGFLGEKNQRVTHFLIGSNILFMPDAFTKMFNMGDDIAVHTWTHPHMTTQSNLQVVAEV